MLKYFDLTDKNYIKRDVRMIRGNNKLNLECVFDKLLEENDKIPKIDEYINKGLEVALEAYDAQNLRYDKQMFIDVTADRLKNTYISKLAELTIVADLRDWLKCEFSECENLVVLDFYCDTILSWDIIVKLNDNVFPIHVTKDSTRESKLRNRGDVNIKRSVKNIHDFTYNSIWVIMTHNTDNDLWLFYEWNEELKEIEYSIDGVISHIKQALKNPVESQKRAQYVLGQLTEMGKTIRQSLKTAYTYRHSGNKRVEKWLSEILSIKKKHQTHILGCESDCHLCVIN